MLFPLSDDDRSLPGPAYVTWALLLANVGVFFFLQIPLGAAFTYAYSAVPLELTTGVDLIGDQSLRVDGQVVQIPHFEGPGFIWLTAVTSMFMHGGFGHLAGNLLYLWIFGDNVEHRFGHRVFLAFYVVSGLAAVAAQVLLDPDSIIPTLGASGAISGVLGAYLVLFPRNKVHALFFVWIVSVPALVAIGLWIVYQFVSGWGTLVAAEQASGGVAYAAHIGGFIAGAVLALLLRMVIKEERPNVFAARVDSRKRLW